MHALTKHLFGAENITPPGVSPPMKDGYGESGWEFEQRLIGGILLAEGPEIGKMKQLQRAVVEINKDTYEISPYSLTNLERYAS